MPWLRGLALLALVSAPLVAADPIADKLKAAKEEYVKDLERVKESLLKAFDKRYEEVKASKSLKLEVQLKQLEALEAEKKAFEESDVLPTSLGMKVGVSEYRTTIKKAETTLKAAFDAAAKGYRDQGDVKAAAATLEEYKEFVAVPKGGVAPAPFVIAAKVSGMVIAPKAGEEGSKVFTTTYDKTDAGQVWKAVPAGDGWVVFEHAKSGLVLSVSGKKDTNGAEVIVAKRDKANDYQLWKLVPVKGEKDLVKFTSKGSGKLMGVDKRSTKSGERLLQWDDEEHAAEWFALIPVK